VSVVHESESVNATADDETFDFLRGGCSTVAATPSTASSTERFNDELAAADALPVASELLATDEGGSVSAIRAAIMSGAGTDEAEDEEDDATLSIGPDRKESERRKHSRVSAVKKAVHKQPACCLAC
jgi:hypothetical protein